MNQKLHAAGQLLQNRYVQIGLIVAGLGVLHLLGWLLPLIRFALLAALVLAGITAGVAVYWLVRESLEQEADSTKPDVSRFKVVSISAGLMVLVCSLALMLLPADQRQDASPQERRKPSETLTSTATTKKSSSKPEAQPAKPTDAMAKEVPQRSLAQAEGSESYREQSESEQADAQAAETAAWFLGSLFQAQIEANRQAENDPRYQEFQRSIQQASQCPRCGGQKVYRYVDSSGNLQAQTCPACLGSGKAF